MAEIGIVIVHLVPRALAHFLLQGKYCLDLCVEDNVSWQSRQLPVLYSPYLVRHRICGKETK